MSISFSAEQYDQEFAAKRLGMYEIPKNQLSKNPNAGSGSTQFIADNKGHLLSGSNRGDSNPFGDFVGTWDLPKSIPGPYHLNPTARSGQNLQSLQQKRDNTQDSIKQAAELLKPVKLRKNVKPEAKSYKVNDAFLHAEPKENNNLDDDNVYYNPEDQNDVPLNL